MKKDDVVELPKESKCGIFENWRINYLKSRSAAESPIGPKSENMKVRISYTLVVISLSTKFKTYINI